MCKLLWTQVNWKSPFSTWNFILNINNTPLVTVLELALVFVVMLLVLILQANTHNFYCLGFIIYLL